LTQKEGKDILGQVKAFFSWAFRVFPIPSDTYHAETVQTLWRNFMRYFALLSAILMFGLMLAASFTGCKGNQFLPQPLYNATNTPTPLPPGTGWTFNTGLTDMVHPSNTQNWAVNYNPNSLSNSVSWDSSVGNPSAGSARLVIGFNGPNQKVDFSLNTVSVPVSLTGKMCYLKYYIDSAAVKNTSYLGLIQIFVKDSAYGWHAGSQNIPTSPGWNDVILQMSSAPSGFHTNSIFEVGVEVATTSSSSVPYTPVTMHVDYWVSPQDIP
jgi:hypothetical protein